MSTGNIPIYHVQHIRACERLALEQFNVAQQLVMERAGKAVFNFLLGRFPRAKKFSVCCGGGNNGGDGYVVARLLHEHGLKVMVWQVGSQDNMPAEAKLAFDACKQSGLPIHLFATDKDLQHPDVIVDALCGIGATQSLRNDLVVAIKKMQEERVPIIAVDVPSGIQADTGQVLGFAICATATVTFIGLKFGLLTGSGMAHAGEVVCDDLQLPQELFLQIKPIAEKIQIESYVHYFKPRWRDWHKGLSGHVLIIGGDLGFSGAARMSAEAALRIGCGLVTVVTRPEHAAVLNVGCPEIMSHGVKDIAQLEPLLSRADVIVIGPGLGQSDWAKNLWKQVGDSRLPTVVDADGLNLLSQTNQFKENWVLTPHPGEAARLLNKQPSAIQQDRLEAAKAIQKRYGGIAVLKGAGSLVAALDTLPALCDKGNPGMATAGVGGIVRGVIGGFIGQKNPIC